MTALMETFDTTMLDSSDADISMYTGDSAGAWLSAEANMMGDGSGAYATSGQDHPSIEVDMEYHDDDITEYEMTDDAGVEQNDPELLDIDFDVSRAPTPILHDYTPGEATPVADTEARLSTLVDPAASVVPNIYLDAAVTTAAPPELALEITTATNKGTMSANSQPAELLPGHRDFDDITSHIVSQLETSDSATSPQGEGAQRLSVGQNGEERLSSPEAQSSIPQVSIGDLSTTHEDADEGRESQTLGPQTKEFSDIPSTKPLATEELDQTEELSANSNGAEGVQTGDTSTDVDTANDQHDTISTHTVETHLEDPHEISEGVYIDPPPAVLISIPASALAREYCLFNQPVPSSGSQSPSTSSAPRMLQLLLHHRPTLYYEPLSVVFDALRHDECLQDLSDLDGDELVLDAYDLQLVISEDNVHVHEVTLHDLNVLHDGADLSGPLRLELRVTSPRFISRYNALREQIARLDLAAEGRDGDEEAHSSIYDGQEVDQLLFAEQSSVQGHEVNISVPVPAAVAVNTRQHEGHAEHEASPSNPIDHQEERSFREHAPQTGDESQGTLEATDTFNASEDAEGEADDSENGIAYREDDFGEDGQNVEAPPGFEDSRPDDLDGNEVHQYADAEEGGDYIEYTEYADDEQQFGEDLPEELGGVADGDGDVHNAFAVEGENNPANAGPLEFDNVFDDVSDSKPAVPYADYAGNATDEIESVISTHERSRAGEVIPSDAITNNENRSPKDRTNEPSDEFTESPQQNSAAVRLDTQAQDVDGSSDELKNEGTELYSDEFEDEDAEGEEDTSPMESFEDAYAPAAYSDLADIPHKVSPVSPSRSSKRGHDELDPEDEGDGVEGSALGSPDTKRLRLQ